MIPISIDQICKWTMGEIVKQGNVETITNITIDSRKASEGSLFIPLSGEKQDGHGFISHAAGNGCKVSLIQHDVNINEVLPDDMSLIQVGSCLDSLQNIAKGYRDLFSVPVIAVTGSNGKTTTKDMVAGVLGVKCNVLKNIGNYNNHIGLPLTLFGLDETHECMVLEMGMSGLGEIELLSSIAKPDIAFITNIGWAHVEKLGSKEMIAQAKIEIVSGLKQGGHLVINGDDEYLCEKTAPLKTKYHYSKVGTLPGNHLRAVEITDQQGSGFTFNTNLTAGKEFMVNHPGRHHIISALFAVWAGQHFNMNHDEIQRGLLQFEPSGMRMEHISSRERLFINDAYNANPDSMKAAIESLKHHPSQKRIFVMGDMLELGKFAEACHRDIAINIIDAGIDDVILVGSLTSFTADELMVKGYQPERIHCANTTMHASRLLNQITGPGDTVLVKGSRSMGMERIIQHFMEGEN